MTEKELELYRKCTKKKRLTRALYELEHEYNAGTNENDYDR